MATKKEVLVRQTRRKVQSNLEKRTNKTNNVKMKANLREEETIKEVIKRKTKDGINEHFLNVKTPLYLY